MKRADLKSEKGELRLLLKERRYTIPDVERQRISTCFARDASSLLSKMPFQTVSVFYSCAGEPDMMPLMTSLHMHGCQVCLPVIQRKAAPLIFRSWKPDMILSFLDNGGIPVPPPAADVIIPTLLFVPLLGFDTYGYRIGYGGGYYDRTIALLRRQKSVHIVGVGFSVQEVVYIPKERHDEKLDAIMTEDGYRLFPLFHNLGHERKKAF
ncbi:MAG: 5-formyltetrahydrofolate cyclo-ligase [Alphaproteobacteria bacterium]|nr:5-formyltetrahydrofolate cyclo-ligase [Alphaproteobacteria bacterium]